MKITPKPKPTGDIVSGGSYTHAWQGKWGHYEVCLRHTGATPLSAAELQEDFALFWAELTRETADEWF